MSEIEKMKRYIERTKLTENDSYYIGSGTAIALARMAKEDGVVDAIALAFDYGKAKGYRAAKAEGRKGAAV